MNPRIVVGVVVAGLIAGGLWLAFHRDRDNGGLVLYGNVDIRQVDLAFAVEGPLARVLVEEGDTVKQGQALAKLDDASYRYGVSQAEAQAATARANRDKAERGNRPQDIDTARAGVDEARTRERNAQVTFSRIQDLAKNDAASRQASDDAQANLNAARATLNARQAALKLAQEGFRSEDIDAARSQADAAEAGAELAKYRLEQTTIIAPTDGIILTRIREPGSMVGPAAPILTLAVSNPVWVRTYVDEPHLGRTAPGTKVSITTDNPAKSYSGVIGFVSPTAEFTPKAVETPELRSDLVYRLRVVVDAPDRSLRQGMPVTIKIAP